MLSILRGALPPRTNIASDNPLLFEDGASTLEFRPATGDQPALLRCVQPPCKKGETFMVPPLHFHITQTEHFRIVSGSCSLMKDSVNEPWKVLDADDPAAYKSASIPPGVYHTFYNASDTKPVVLDISRDPEDLEAEERFFRNFFGYMDDCRKAGTQPSFFQLAIFLHDSDTPLGLPIAPHWLGVLASKAFIRGLAFVGKWVLGYQSTYDEYHVVKPKMS